MIENTNQPKIFGVRIVDDICGYDSSSHGKKVWRSMVGTAFKVVPYRLLIP